MAPIRGQKRKRKTDKNTEENASGAGFAQQEGSVDWWDGFSKRINGLESPLKDLDRFQYIFKMSRKTFDYICLLVRDDMMAKSREFTFLNGDTLCLQDQVAIALRRLGSGDSLVTVADSFGVNHSTVSQVTWRFVEAMEEGGFQHLRWPSSESEMMEIKSKFEKIQGLPNCCGAIDTTHIRMMLPATDSANDVWLDHQGNHSMVLQVIVDPEMKIRDIITGWPGMLEDRVVFQSSNFYKSCEQGEKLNAKKLHFSEESEIGEYIVGDSGFPLLPYLMVPYQVEELTESRSEFNKQLYATQIVAKQALARLKDTWRLIRGEMWRPDRHKLPRFIYVCCLLHNIIIELEDEVQRAMPVSHDHDPDYKDLKCGVFDLKGAYMRDALSLCLSGRLQQ